MSHYAVVVKCNTYHAYYQAKYSSYPCISEMVMMEPSLKICQRTRTHQCVQDYICEDNTSELAIDRQGKNCCRLHYMRICHGPETFYYHDYWLRCLLMICWCKLCDILVFRTINYSHHVFPCRLTCYSFRRVTTTKHTKQWIKLCHDICHGPCKEGGMCDIVNGTPTIIAV